MEKEMIGISYILAGLMLIFQPDLKSESYLKPDNLNVDSGLNAKFVPDPIPNNKKSTLENPDNFIPDSTINGKLILEDYKSFTDFDSDNKSVLTIDKVWESPVIIFSNISGTQYLLAYQYEGGSKYAFDCFEIGYFADEPILNGKQVYKTDINIFKTESNLSPGMSIKELTRIKGQNYKINILKDKILITYRIEDSSFVKRYKMPGYFMKFLNIDDKVVKLTFGFDYP